MDQDPTVAVSRNRRRVAAIRAALLVLFMALATSAFFVSMIMAVWSR